MPMRRSPRKLPPAPSPTLAEELLAMPADRLARVLPELSPEQRARVPSEAWPRLIAKLLPPTK